MFKKRAGHETSECTPRVPATWEAEVGEWGDEKRNHMSLKDKEVSKGEIQKLKC